jgi:hypothetical protein
MSARYLCAVCRRVNGPGARDILRVARMLATLGEPNNGKIAYQPWGDGF